MKGWKTRSDITKYAMICIFVSAVVLFSLVAVVSGQWDAIGVLKGMTNLEELWICCLYQADRQKKVSDKDVRELQEALPNCRIIGP